MSREQLKHIFDQSSCLTKKQLTAYVDGSMTGEEAHAVELHLNSCPMCKDAVDGLLAENGKGTATMSEINADFLKAHMLATNITMQTNNNTGKKTPKPAPAMVRTKRIRSYFAFRVTSIAATILLALAAIWYYRLSEDARLQHAPIAQEMPAPTQSAPEIAAAPQETVAAIVEDMQTAESMVAADMQADKAVLPNGVAQKGGVVAMADASKEKEKPSMLKRLGEKIENAATKKATQQVMGAIKNDNPDKYATSAKNQYAEEQKQKPQDERANSELEKMPSRTVAPSVGNAYESNTEDVANAARSKDKEEAISKTDQADKLYQAGRHGDALNLYTQEMRGASNKGKRQEAAIGAAKCYLAMGNRYKAKDILISIVNEGGPRKREAKRMLKELGWEE
ncbi:hypothetical protein CAP35_00755 [Chitinophagaceae bacterium IBVUCB1]|nr:hypothetical protein CAP35_00755 [Chitinophagaceae bacterium IBVUCB1]